MTSVLANPIASMHSGESFPESVELRAAGGRMRDLVAELYPICRSITGNGVRETLRRVGRRIPLDVHEVPTGTRVLDWTIPKEWNIRDAWVMNAAGEKVIDFRRSNLHVLNYSVPVRRTMTWSELRPHLHTLPEHPEWIPYRTSYYRETWGFCLSENDLRRLEAALVGGGEFEVCIDSTLEGGSLTWGECYLPGRSAEEILLTCHVCHPSLCNDNLSGIALLTELAGLLADVRREHSYRFLFIPGTIGSIAWLALNRDAADRVRHGLVVACVGDAGRFHYKRSRRGDAAIDRAAAHVLADRPEGGETRDFSPYGYDERQFCSPGFNLPMGRLSRTPHGEFPEYHTSADNLDLVRPEALAGSLDCCLSILRVLERDRRYVNRNPFGEPQLGRRGLYRAMGGFAEAGRIELALLWVLNLSDGEHSLLDIAERSRLPFDLVHHAARLLGEHELLEEARR